MCNEKVFNMHGTNLNFMHFINFYCMIKMWTHIEIPCAAVKNISGAFLRRDSETERTATRIEMLQ